MVKRLLPFLLILLVPLVFASNLPYPSVPLPIKNTIYMSNSSDYAVYKITLNNPTNRSFYYYFQTISLGWQFIYPQGMYTLPPYSTKNVIVKLRPYKYTSEMPILSITFSNNSKKISYTIYFSPIVISAGSYEKAKRTYGLEFSARLLKKYVEVGDQDLLYISIDSFYSVSKPVCIKVSSVVIDRPITSCFNIEKRKYYIGIPLKISTSVLPGKYPIKISIDNITKDLFINITKKENITVTETSSKIIIRNNDNFVNTYTLKVEISPADKFFYIYTPKPDYELQVNNKVYYVWNIVLLPHETFIIHKSLNIASILLIILIIVLAIAYLVASYYTPKLEVTKEVLSINKDKREIKIMISIKNKSAYKIKDVIIKDTILSIFKPKKFEFIKPVGFFEKDGKINIKWIIDELLPGEERIIVYTLKYDTEVVGELHIEPVEVEITVWNKKHVAYSNTIILDFSEKEEEE